MALWVLSTLNQIQATGKECNSIREVCTVVVLLREKIMVMEMQGIVINSGV